jgi:hypothetical protein
LHLDYKTASFSRDLAPTPWAEPSCASAAHARVTFVAADAARGRGGWWRQGEIPVTLLLPEFPTRRLVKSALAR